MTDPAGGWIPLAEEEFFLLWWANQPRELPVPLGVRHFGAVPADRAELVEACSDTLSARGLGTVRDPEPRLAALLRVLAAPTMSVQLLLEYPTGAGQALAVVDGERGVLATRLGADVHLAPIRGTALAPAAAGLLPASPAAPGRAANVRVADYQAACLAGREDGAEAFLAVLRSAGVREPEARTVHRAVAGRYGGGHLGATGRDRRRAATTVTWLDTDEGRYLARGRDGWLVVTPADQARVAEAVAELVQEAHRG
ncbi:ESX secretion-associated protein EspG [Solihabitans fulvus]|uniref:ESX secretion-associated protein EspG n=1 Tax=Solihabitans fulvus TaxID=1892852 RepID=A0A5B2XEH0_9PSEU|nr:ESX secretion-associated protein EspG [Solihabitans fulvus]KAA2262178.1 ESX secretion-associated protein EspG [Solihabitans fulvus]